MDRKEIIERCARAAHEVNRVFCESLGDLSQKPWDEAEDWQRDASRKGVIRILKGELEAGDTHASWMEDKIDDGWKWGPVKDSKKKEHPSLVPFEKLPLPEKIKDTLFIATVQGVLSVCKEDT